MRLSESGEQMRLWNRRIARMTQREQMQIVHSAVIRNVSAECQRNSCGDPGKKIAQGGLPSLGTVWHWVRLLTELSVVVLITHSSGKSPVSCVINDSRAAEVAFSSVHIHPILRVCAYRRFARFCGACHWSVFPADPQREAGSATPTQFQGRSALLQHLCGARWPGRTEGLPQR